MILIVMGVSGCGKSTVGAKLAAAKNLPFYDGDNFHSPGNIEKMRQGIPLNDEDRQPWLETLSKNIQQWEKEGGAVLACSALKEKYRKTLQSVPDVKWIFLEGSRSLIEDRLRTRSNHYMSSALLDSQFYALEKPAYGIHIDISLHPDQIVEQVLIKLENISPLSQFGLIGMGVMGKSLALNLVAKSVKISIYNRHIAGQEVDVAKNVVKDNPSFTCILGFDDLREFIASLERPRKILLMIPAGKAVDLQIEQILPLLEEGDVLIDGGNSFYKDTSGRVKTLAEKSIHFVGCGISGGEEGALKGPSLMPGGSREGYYLVKDYLNLLAARDKNNTPCSVFIGPEGSGHFIKMVHNGIEYAEMQVLAEIYHILKNLLSLSSEKISEALNQWKLSGSDSYLLEITIDILKFKEGNELLVDKILDQAEQKGTGSWSVNAALENGVAYGPLTEAVMARAMSANKIRRVKTSALYNLAGKIDDVKKEELIIHLHHAYKSVRILNHHIGFDLIKEVSEKNNWNLNLSEIARIWTNGCIIRSELMENLSQIFKEETDILMAPSIVDEMQKMNKGFAETVSLALRAGLSIPVLSSALNYFYGYISADSPANLIQAQRDYFGAHTYRRKDKPEDQYFHTIWKV